LASGWGRWIVLAVVVVAVAVVVGAILSSGGGAADGAPFAAAPAFTLPAVDSGQPSVSLPAVPGRPVVLTFFAAWCAPCTRELPVIERLWRSVQVEGPGAPTVIGVDELDQRPDGPDLVRRTGVTFPSGYDHDGAVGRHWAVDGLPITAFIAPDGRVVAYHRGELDAAQLDVLVHRLVAARQ
jgi:peroxiredoxin